MNEAVSYTIPSPAEQLYRQLPDALQLKIQDLPAHVRAYYDTFDWRLYRSNALLEMTPDKAGNTLRWIEPGRMLRCRLESEEVPGFSWEVPAGPLKDALEPISKMRRLLPVVYVESKGLLLHVLGPEEKTVARIKLLDSRARVPGDTRARELPSTLELIPIKGYEGYVTSIIKYVEEELGLTRESEDTFHRAVRVVEIEPGDYSSKFQVELDPSMEMGMAVRTIYKVLLEDILINEEGTRQDLDSEFLHDFRVAVRRTRSALSQIKKIFPPDIRKQFQEEFSWLGQVTGPNRDLDVYLLKMADFESILPANVRRDLKPLYEFLHRRQREEHQLLVKALDSKRFATLKESWRSFLHESQSADDLPAASEPVRTGASRRIWKVYRKILRKGNAITDRSPAEALHELRIECKKLRYLLEFFRSLYESKRIRRLIKSLKLLQDNLGDFNDCEVQQRTLKGFAHSMMEEGSASADMLMAMGRLVEHLEFGQKSQRELFAGRFAKFAEPKNDERFRELFSPRKVKAP